ncbi:MAG: hypothetical protein SVV88_10955 [Pseudomonadota bacterium]|nr:hypothetical protein [Pseudomonadota bacterium]
MALSLINTLASVQNLFAKNNTITSSYDISADLQNRVSKIYQGTQGMNQDFPMIETFFPAIFIEIDTKLEEISQLGKSARRDVEMSFDIVLMTYYGMGSGDEGVGRENASKELLYLAQNVESLLRNKITLSGTVDWSIIESTDYSSVVGDATYNSAGIIKLKAQKLTT